MNIKTLSGLELKLIITKASILSHLIIHRKQSSQVKAIYAFMEILLMPALSTMPGKQNRLQKYLLNKI